MQKYKLGKHEVRVCGKAVETDAGIELVHSGSFIEFYGEIGKVSMKISGNADESDFAAYVGVFLNEGDTPETVWKIQDGLHHYEICWTSEKKNTVVKVMKLTEMQYGAVQIHSVDTDGNIKPTEPKERKLLFIGDSITAGYGVNGEQSDTVFTTKTEDVTKAYPYLTAKEVSADPWYVCWSGRILSRAAYVVLGVTVEGYKDILSITVGANETSKFWLGMLNDLKNRGVKDVLFFCVDGLPGFKEAIQAVYPQAEIQRCVIHMLRNSFKYVNYTDLKKFSSDFKAVYNAPNETAALSELENIKEKWGKKYPYAISNWENNWEDVSSFFQFSDDIRRIMYTTNIIEGLNRQYRKVTKTKSVFPSDTALEKMLYLASENVVKKWTQRYRNWDQVLNQLIVLYGERLTNYL